MSTSTRFENEAKCNSEMAYKGTVTFVERLEAGIQRLHPGRSTRFSVILLER